MLFLKKYWLLIGILIGIGVPLGRYFQIKSTTKRKEEELRTLEQIVEMEEMKAELKAAEKYDREHGFTHELESLIKRAKLELDHWDHFS